VPFGIFETEALRFYTPEVPCFLVHMPSAAVEYPLNDKISDPAPSVKTVTATVGPDTLADVLNRLCALDPTFTWIRIGNTVNVLPSALAKDPTYFLNRRSYKFTFQEARARKRRYSKLRSSCPDQKNRLRSFSLEFP
jgi:hypothetical protein